MEASSSAHVVMRFMGLAMPPISIRDGCTTSPTGVGSIILNRLIKLIAAQTFAFWIHMLPWSTPKESCSQRFAPAYRQ